MKAHVSQNLMRRARRVAFGSGHMLTRFHCGRDGESKDLLTYGASCRFCGGFVLVLLDSPCVHPGEERPTPVWRIVSGLSAKCHQGERK